MIVVRRSAGRLGNQIFQVWFALSQRRGAEQILINDVGDFLAYFDPPRGVHNYSWHSRTRMRTAIETWRLLRWGARVGLVASMAEQTGVGGRIESALEKPGLLPVMFVDGGYWQNIELLDDAVLGQVRLQTKVIRDAERLIKEAQEGVFCRPIFVHVRRGDYLSFRGGIALEYEYYLSAMTVMRNRYSNCRFFFCTDDPEWVSESGLVGKEDVLVDGNVGLALGVMVSCEGGVIANSSLSWWAGYKLLACNPNALIIGPEYFMGWKKRQWDPRGLRTKRFRWIDPAPSSRRGEQKWG